MDSEKLGKGACKSSSQGRKKSASIRRDLKKVKTAVCLKLKVFNYGLFLFTLIQAAKAYIIQPDIIQQTNNKPVTQITQLKQNQHIVFKEVGKMVMKMKHIHVIVPLNNSLIYIEAGILRNSLLQMSYKTFQKNAKFHSLKQLQKLANMDSKGSMKQCQWLKT